MLKRRVVQVVLVGVFLCCASSALASEVKELAMKGRLGDGAFADRVLCVDGLKVFQTIAFGYGSGTGAAVSNIQLYEEKNGKVVPVRCYSENGAKK